MSWSDDDERLVAEVSGNRVLADKFRLTKDLRRHLRLAGWNRPDEDHPNYWIDVDPAFPDRPAAMLVAAARPRGWRARPFRLNSTLCPPGPRYPGVLCLEVE